MPIELTTRLSKPARPRPHCIFQGAPAICLLDALKVIPIYDALLDLANSDRGRVELLGRTDGTQ